MDRFLELVSDADRLIRLFLSNMVQQKVRLELVYQLESISCFSVVGSLLQVCAVSAEDVESCRKRIGA